MKKINIKTPSNIYIWWNFGSLISMYMFIQIMIGFILAMNYMISKNPFYSSFFIYYNINFGWMMRIFHSNMTSMIFIITLIHIKRNFMFNSFFIYKMWYSGMMMFILLMMISFLGYSLIWTQMSYWGMMVITNFISSIPWIGKNIMIWLWGNFNINIILINRFFVIHFISPMIMMLMIMIHINILHLNKSNNPLGINNKIDLINLNPYSIIKDMIMFIILMDMFINLNMFFPFMLNNFDNFNMMNYFITPNHIEPEWYFLFFYSILRSIPNKLSGLLMMIFSIFIIIMIPIFSLKKIQSNKFNPMMKIFFILLLFLIINISILGSKMIEYPYNIINSSLIELFFISFMILNLFKLKNLFWK